MMGNEPAGDLRELIAAHLSGDLTESQRSELNALLLRSETARAEFAAALRQEVLLGEILRNERSGASEPAPKVTRELRPGTRRRTARRLSLRPSGPYWAGSVAAAGLFGILLLVALPPSGRGLKDTRKEASVKSDGRRPTQGEKSKHEPDPAEMKRREPEEPPRKAEEVLRPPAPAPAEEKRAEPSQKERIEREMRESIERARSSPTNEPRGPKPPSAPTVTKTVPVIARVEEVSGEAFLETKEGRSPAKSGVDLLEGQGLSTGTGASRVRLVFPDKTGVELGPETEVREVRAGPGKRFFVAKGMIRAEVAKQPKDQPMICVTPHAEAEVLGTTLRLVVDPEPGKKTRLDVDEGKVKLKNLAGKTVTVESGHYAVAAVGVELLVAKPQEPPAVALLEASGQVTISFGPERRKVPPGVVIDSGEPFETKRGYGWMGPNERNVVYTTTGETLFRRRAWFDPGREEQDLRASYVTAGTQDLNSTEAWVIKLPKGRYLVTVCAGRYGGSSGPNHVQVAGALLIDSFVPSSDREFLERADVPVEVKDGTLKVVVGGSPRKVASDSLPNTDLNYIRIRKARP